MPSASPVNSSFPLALHATLHFQDELDAHIAEGLMQQGITQLYSHQREAWDRITTVEHVVIVTPTASGKTLCYNLR